MHLSLVAIREYQYLFNECFEHWKDRDNDRNTCLGGSERGIKDTNVAWSMNTSDAS